MVIGIRLGLGLSSGGQRSSGLVQSAEIGLVDASTLVVTFSAAVTATDYATGVTITVAGNAATISSATRQSNHAIVRYVLATPVIYGQVVTWAYDGSGTLADEATSAALAAIAARAVANNVAIANARITTSGDYRVTTSGEYRVIA